MLAVPGVRDAGWRRAGAAMAEGTGDETWQLVRAEDRFGRLFRIGLRRAWGFDGIETVEIGYNPAIFLRLKGPAVAGIDVADLADAEMTIGGEPPRRPRVELQHPDGIQFDSLFDLRMLMGLMLGLGLDVQSRALSFELEAADIDGVFGRLVGAMQTDSGRLKDTSLANAEVMQILSSAAVALPTLKFVSMTGEATVARFGNFDGAMVDFEATGGEWRIHAAIRMMPERRMDEAAADAALQALGEGLRSRAKDDEMDWEQVPPASPARRWARCRLADGGVTRTCEFGVVDRQQGGAYLLEIGAAGGDRSPADTVDGLRRALLEACRTYREE